MIKNQIEICKEYVEKNPQFNLVETFIENGKTGTTFDRPEFNRLMEEIRQGKIKCLIVRDLSRFGRDYIETGTYLERIFPNIGLRFISIKERYDSFTIDTTNEALMIPLQNMINSLYSKDISRKVSSAIKVRMEDGSFRTGSIPFGYMWNENKEVVVDKEVAHYVKMMFQWKIEGISVREIVNRLNDMNVPTADFRKYETGVKSGNGRKKVSWSAGTLYRIWKNPFYIGDRLLGKTERALYKGINSQIAKDKEKQIYYKDTHEPLISREDFEKVRVIMEFASAERQRKMTESDATRAKFINLFEGKIFCADCGSKMYFRKHKRNYSRCKEDKGVWYAVYVCSHNARRLSPMCTPHNLQLNQLEEKVLTAIKLQVKVALNYEKLLISLQESAGEKSLRDHQNAVIKGLDLKLNGMQKRRERLYEDFVEGILSEEEYTYIKTSFDDSFEKLNLQLEDAVLRRRKFNEAMSSENKWIQLMKSVSKAKKLTQALVDECVEKVEVHEGGNIELTMKYSDIYALTVSCVKEIKKKEKTL